MNTLALRWMPRWNICVTVACLLYACGSGFNPAYSQQTSLTSSTPAYGLAAATAFDQLPLLQPSVMAGQQSSFDPTMGNKDYSQYLYQDSHGHQVMLDQVGPGVIYRIWIASWPIVQGVNENEVTLRVYLDNNPTPVIQGTLKDLTQGNSAALPAPLVANYRASSHAWTLYRPIPYQSRAIVTVDNATGTFGPYPHRELWYDIGYHSLPAID